MKPYTVVARHQREDHNSIILSNQDDRVQILITAEDFERAKLGATIWYHYVPPVPGYDNYSFTNPEVAI